MKLSVLKNEIENLSDNARNELLRDVLLKAAQKADDRIVPLNANHKEIVRREKEEEKECVFAGAAIALGIAGLLCVAAFKGKQAIERKAEEEKAKFEQDKKELYRRLASIKGRV